MFLSLRREKEIKESAAARASDAKKGASQGLTA
jgi:hypothetical protein